jgi:hypothetical protein
VQCRAWALERTAPLDRLFADIVEIAGEADVQLVSQRFFLCHPRLECLGQLLTVTVLRSGWHGQFTASGVRIDCPCIGGGSTLESLRVELVGARSCSTRRPTSLI